MERPSIGELGRVIALDVNRTIGGGYASMELIRRRFTSRGWLDAAGHGLIVAVSRLTPGTNILAYCVLLGWRFHRWRGAVMALVAGSLPASVIIYLLIATLVRVDQYTVVQFLLAVGILIASGLVLSSAWALARPYLKRALVVRAGIVTAVALVLAFFGATPVRILLAAAIVGAVLPPGETAR